jgi:flagellar basal-body rod protein FlgF
MPDLVDAAMAILAQAERRTEIAGQNVANATSPAYKRRVAFASLVNGADKSRPIAPQILTGVDFRPGKLVQTGNPYDLAVTGPGFFAVHHEDGMRFTRSGRFTRRDDGRLIDTTGGVLQAVSGGDVIVADRDFEVRSDGRIFIAGAEAGKVALFETPNPGRLTALDGGFADNDGSLSLSADPHLVQGAYEASNVTTGDEMVLMMQALRLAEAGQRVMITYDDLMGRAISTFGDSVK